ARGGEARERHAQRRRDSVLALRRAPNAHRQEERASRGVDRNGSGEDAGDGIHDATRLTRLVLTTQRALRARTCRGHFFGAALVAGAGVETLGLAGGAPAPMFIPGIAGVGASWSIVMFRVVEFQSPLVTGLP